MRVRFQALFDTLMIKSSFIAHLNSVLNHAKISTQMP